MDNKQNEVFDAIKSEREYQDSMVANSERPDMIEDLHIGDTIAAMQYNLEKAREAWYKGSTPHQGAMEYIRKVCGLGVQAGEKYGMPKRESLSGKTCPYIPYLPVENCEKECICNVKHGKNDDECPAYDHQHGCLASTCICASNNPDL